VKQAGCIWRDFDIRAADGLTNVRKNTNTKEPAMPRTKVVFFREKDGTVPLLDWLDSLPKKAQAKCIARLERLALLGHELRRPEADLLRDGIHELRVGLQGINYRMLYFFYGQAATVVSHAL